MFTLMNEVKSAKRVLEILQFFAASQAPASMSQIAGALGFPKSSCLALLDTLEADGYAYQTAGGYYLTRRWLSEARAVAEHDPLVARIHPTLERLRDELGETLILAGLAGDQVIYLDVAEAGSVVRFSAAVGQRKPVYASASGRALLSTLPQPQQRSLLQQLTFKAFTDATPASAEAVLQAIERGARRGWHLNDSEHQRDTLSIAAPLQVHDDPLALVVGAPAGRAQARVEAIGATLAAAARDLQRTLTLSQAR